MKAAEASSSAEETPAVLGLSTWGALYGVVLAFFLICVLLLTVLPWLFS